MRMMMRRPLTASDPCPEDLNRLDLVIKAHALKR